MRFLMILLGVVCLAMPACAPAPEPEPEAAPEPVFDQAADEAAVRQAMKQFIAAYNAKDAKAMSALYADDYETWTGTPSDLAAWLSGPQKSHLEVEDIGIVFVAPDVAIYKCRDKYTDRLDEDGKPLPPSKLLVAVVYAKRSGQWLRVAAFVRPEE